tara:strand:- start:21 stop:227 length:207 start_codon:yes stop_codon:yes gene_type:complete
VVINYRYYVWFVGVVMTIKEEFLVFANQKRIAWNMEQFAHGLEEVADVETFIKHFPDVLEDWLNEQKE